MVSYDSHIMIELKQTLWSLAFLMSWQLMVSTAWNDFQHLSSFSWCLPVRCWIILLWVLSPLKFDFNAILDVHGLSTPYTWLKHLNGLSCNCVNKFHVHFFFWLCVPILLKNSVSTVRTLLLFQCCLCYIFRKWSTSRRNSFSACSSSSFM